MNPVHSCTRTHTHMHANDDRDGTNVEKTQNSLSRAHSGRLWSRVLSRSLSRLVLFFYFLLLLFSFPSFCTLPSRFLLSPPPFHTLFFLGLLLHFVSLTLGFCCHIPLGLQLCQRRIFTTATMSGSNSYNNRSSSHITYICFSVYVYSEYCSCFFFSLRKTDRGCVSVDWERRGQVMREVELARLFSCMPR